MTGRARRQQRKRARAKAARLSALIATLRDELAHVELVFAAHYIEDPGMSIEQLMRYSGNASALQRDILHAEHSA